MTARVGEGLGSGGGAGWAELGTVQVPGYPAPLRAKTGVRGSRPLPGRRWHYP